MAVVPFIKASACGNDFLLVHLSDVAPHGLDLPELTRRMCHRHDGVGADGIEFLLPDTAPAASDSAGAPVETDVRIRLINADGSPAEISGNGTRCVAAYLASQKDASTITIRTDAGVKTCKLIQHNGNSFEFETEMGKPEVGPAFPIKCSFGEVTGVPVSMGNPHFVIFVRKFIAGWQAEGAEISKHPRFQQGTNVEFVHVQDRSSISVRFFERGAGETLSSGTGSCGAAVAAIHTRKVVSPISVHAQGGTQIVRWENEVFLSGPARLVCRGEFFI